VGWPNFVYLPDWVGLVRHGDAVISGWWGIVEQVRPETKNPPARGFSGGGCLGFGSRTKVLHSVRPDRHTHATRTPCTGPGALLCVRNRVHFCNRTLCARQVLFHGPFSFRPRWSESAPHIRFGSQRDRGANGLNSRRGNRSDLRARQQNARSSHPRSSTSIPAVGGVEWIAAYRCWRMGRRGPTFSIL
jgi:hypothetical protein